MLIRLNKIPFSDNGWNLRAVFNIYRTKVVGGEGGERGRGAEEGRIGRDRGVGRVGGRELWWKF